MERLDIGTRQLNRLIEKRARELPSTREQALFTIAHDNGMKLPHYLTAAQIADVRTLIQARPAPAAGPSASAKRRDRSGTNGAKRIVTVTIAGFDVQQLPGMTATHAKEAKMMAEKVYPKLYVFENSARDLISRVLKSAIGDDWWDKVVLPKLRTKAEGRKKDEAKDPWHGKRGAALIDYLDLSDLPLIVTAPKAWPHFKAFFDRPSWFQELVNELNVSRRVAAHMNPLEDDDVKNVEAAFRKWAKLMKAKADLIP